MDKILVTGSAGLIGFHLSKILLKNGHQVIGLDNYYTGQTITEANLNEISIKANNININADITTNYSQIYDGHVLIGDNGSNGPVRTLSSIDPSITFIAQAYIQSTSLGVNADGSAKITYGIPTTRKYSYNDADRKTPTHSLVLNAKGYCYVKDFTCGAPGTLVNVRYDKDGNPFKGDFGTLLKDVSFDVDVMLIPRPEYVYHQGDNFKDNAQVVKGIIVEDKTEQPIETQTFSGTSSQSYTYVGDTDGPGIPDPGNGTPGGNPSRGSPGDGGSISSGIKSTALFEFKRPIELTSDVVIGNVQASFIADDTSSAKCKESVDKGCK